MHWNDRAGSRRDGSFNRSDIDVVKIIVIDKDRTSTCQHNAFGSRDECIHREDHLIPCTYTQRPKCKMNSRSTVADAYRKLRLVCFGKLRFEVLHVWAENVCR